MIRAVRNNNPGNIRIGQNWQGEMPRSQMNADQLAEKEFEVYLTPVWGFRAMASIFHAYADKHGITTIRGAISRWAPPNENNTGAYVNAVCQRTQRQPDAPFPFHDVRALADLCRAVSIQEVGSWAFNYGDALTGVRLSR